MRYLLLALLLTGCITDGDFGLVKVVPKETVCWERYKYRKPGEDFDRINVRPVKCDGAGHKLEVGL